MDITDLIGETTEYDKKLLLEEKRPRSWLKSVSAFANGSGGMLIFGVSNDNILAGLENAEIVSEKISEIMKVKMDPVPDFQLEIHRQSGKEFIILRIASGQETPYYYVGDGNHIAYVRIGNESVPADSITLKRLVLHGSNTTFDSLVSPYPFRNYSFTRLRSAYLKRTGTELSDSDFISFDLADESGMLTYAGALLADESPVRYSRLFCTRWYGLDKASGVMEALDDKEYSGSLISLLQDGMAFIQNNTKKRWKKTGTGRVEMPEYPEQAVHECLVNALIHRDYTEVGSEVHIDIFDDRMEIYSPGGMFDGSLVQNLDTDKVASRRRNPIIADIFSRMHYMERRGSGFRKIKTDYHNAINFVPELEPGFSSTPTSFFVTLYNLNYCVPVKSAENMSAETEKVTFEAEKATFHMKKVAFEAEKAAFECYLSSIKANAPTKEKAATLFNEYMFETIFSRADIMKKFNMASSSAGKMLNKLKDSGTIEPVSGYGKGKYRFSKKNPAADEIKNQ